MGKRAAPKTKKKAVSVKNKSIKAKPKKENAPKRPATAFFIFLEDFRQTYKRDHPKVKGVAVIGKAGGNKWKAMTEEEKAPYLTKAAKRKADYDKDMETYNNKKDEDNEEEEDAGEESEDDKSKPTKADNEEEEASDNEDE